MSPLFGWLNSGARGELVPDDVTIAAPPLSAENFRVLFRQALQDERGAALHHERITHRLAELREMGMARRDLRRAMQEEDALVAAPGPTPPRPPVEMVRVRVREGFSHHWLGLPYDGTPGSVLDLPAELVEEAPPERFERVDADTPLHRVQPTPR